VLIFAPKKKTLLPEGFYPMSRNAKRKSHKAGLPPGSLVHIGEQRVDKAFITLFEYDEKDFCEMKVERIEKVFECIGRPTVKWIDVDAVHDTGLVKKIGDRFQIHPLVLEDIVSATQRPKIEIYDGYLFAVIKMLTYDENSRRVDSEQISMIAGEGYLITFQETPGDVFDSVRERIRSARGRIRQSGVDYLMYSLMDAVVDNYFIILEKFSDDIEKLEEAVVENPSVEVLHAAHAMKREMIYLRRQVWPLREVLSSMTKSGIRMIGNDVIVYLRDVHDHTIQIIETLETQRDILSGILDIYLSSMSNRMNEVMKVLTIIATIFIPLTFIAGVYGMNFKFMPELEWRWGYFMVWGIMIVTGSGLLIYFKKKDWF
jgi:magnesium transporter